MTGNALIYYYYYTPPHVSCAVYRIVGSVHHMTYNLNPAFFCPQDNKIQMQYNCILVVGMQLLTFIQGLKVTKG